QLGGALIPASAAPFKADMKDYLDWTVRMTMNTPGLTVKLNTEATEKNILDEKPDALVVAVGAEPVPPEIPCANDSGIVWAGDVLMNMSELGETVLVTGAGLTGCETALHLAGQGKKVTLIDMLPASRIAAEVPLINMMALRGMLAKKNVNIITEVKLESVENKGAVIIDKNWQRTEIPCDNVVLSTGVKPMAEAVSKLDHLAPEVFVIGDCAFKRGNLCRATTSGFNAAMDI
ncbi:MAG: NAD(P)/FAD-dependent oxidoreductase, partial [Desulfobacteraceae bacterium]|nr:NAD(P)/FAD-dependent oxidoreductase [Desulfobacteraceae bacterium]